METIKCFSLVCLVQDNSLNKELTAIGKMFDMCRHGNASTSTVAAFPESEEEGEVFLLAKAYFDLKVRSTPLLNET